MMRLSLIFTAAIAALSTTSFAQRLTYLLDDGFGENCIGRTLGGEIAAANQFKTVGDKRTVTEIQVTWGCSFLPGSAGIQPGQEFRWFIWNDVAGEWKTDYCELVAQGTARVDAAAIETDAFQRIPVGNVRVGTKGFFVGVAIEHEPFTYPLWLDTTGPGSEGFESWIGSGGTRFDPNDISQWTIFRLNQVEAGALGIRAVAVKSAPVRMGSQRKD